MNCNCWWTGITSRLKLTLTVVAELVEDGPDLGAVGQACLLDLLGSGNVYDVERTAVHLELHGEHFAGSCLSIGYFFMDDLAVHHAALEHRCPETERVGVRVRCASQALRRTPEVHEHGARRRHK